MNTAAEFFRALYWSHEGRDVRLTTYNERDLPEHVLTPLAFERARRQNLSPIYMRIRFGEFMRHGNDNEIGIAFAVKPGAFVDPADARPAVDTEA